MSLYTREQSLVVALWVLAQTSDRVKAKSGARQAPRPIVELVNAFGGKHSADSIFLHQHGYERLLLGRDIDKTVSETQRAVAQSLVEAGLIEKIHDAE
ncbi:MAG TPA: hypothetical protein VMP01_00555 [Pirellulaceae bacterium]|nr:hypothetical protein [Pirellulaceae bacterium]